MTTPPDYLGDGVYASFDGYYIWLRTGSHQDADATNRIALEPSVLDALLRYQARIVGDATRRETPATAAPSSCEFEDCDDEPQVVFKGAHFCPYHALLNLLMPAGPLVVQQALQQAHPLWQVSVIAGPPGTQGPADPAALGTDVHELHADLSRLGEEREWIFTFGSGHELHGESLGKAFVRIRGTALVARGRMIELFGVRWSHQYATEEAAGVQQFGLTELPLPPKEPRDG